MFRIMKIIVQVILLVMLIVVSLQIFFRYILNQPLAWTEEVARLLFIWMVFLGATLAIKDNTHLKMDYFYDRFPEKIKKAVELLHNILIIGFSVSILISGIQILSITADEVLPGSEISLLFYYTPVPLSAIFIILTLLFLKYKKRGVGNR